MLDEYLSPEDIAEAFPTVDLSLNKPLWLVGVNFLPRKQVVLAEWSGLETSGLFGRWVKLYGGLAYLAKQGFNFGPKRGYYIAEMAASDLVQQHTKKLHATSMSSTQLLLDGAKSTLMLGVFVGPNGLPFIQTPIHGGRSARWGGGASASVGLILQHINREPGLEDGTLPQLVREFAAYCELDRSPLVELDQSYIVPFALTEEVTMFDWQEVAVQAGAVPASMFEDPPDEEGPFKASDLMGD